jgi:hypothetical protein
MIAVWIEEMDGSDRVPRPAWITRRALVGTALLPLERNGALLRVHAAVCSKELDTADIVREGDLSLSMVGGQVPVEELYGNVSPG